MLGMDVCVAGDAGWRFFSTDIKRSSSLWGEKMLRIIDIQ
jgi:hypothetical protein